MSVSQTLFFCLICLHVCPMYVFIRLTVFPYVQVQNCMGATEQAEVYSYKRRRNSLPFISTNTNSPSSISPHAPSAFLHPSPSFPFPPPLLKHLFRGRRHPKRSFHAGT